jgi:dienelactone hydrolase
MNDPNRSKPTEGFIDPRRIVVVGPCASGKSTLVAALRAHGYDARVSGQEHSVVAALWQKAEPDVLIALDADITAVRDRRGESWPEWLHDLQIVRLRQANAAAHMRIDTSGLSADRVTDLVLEYLENGSSPRLEA